MERPSSGLFLVLKLKFKILTKNSSYEINMFVFNRSHPVLFAVIYRPPKYNKDFLSDFTDLLSGLMPKYDRVLIVRDFIIHVCCHTMPVVKDF